MKTGLVFLVSVCMYAVAANTLRTNKTHREVVVNQLCQHSGANTLREITSQLKKEFETLKKELTQQLIKMSKKDNGGISKWNKSQLKKEFETLKNELTQQLIKMSKKYNGDISKWNKTQLKKEFETLKKELTQQLIKMNKKDNGDGWLKLNTNLVCFGARDNRFGKFLVPSSGKLASVKLVHVYGYVACAGGAIYWSYWGCGRHSSLKNHVDAVITTSGGSVLLPSSQLISDKTHKWSLIPGYHSLSPELVLSAFSNPPSVNRGQELRLWYGEDLANSSESDNGGTACCDVYARLI